MTADAILVNACRQETKGKKDRQNPSTIDLFPRRFGLHRSSILYVVGGFSGSIPNKGKIMKAAVKYSFSFFTAVGLHSWDYTAFTSRLMTAGVNCPCLPWAPAERLERCPKITTVNFPSSNLWTEMPPSRGRNTAAVRLTVQR